MKRLKNVFGCFKLMKWVAVLPIFFFCKTPIIISETKTDSVVVYRDTTIEIAGRSDTFYLPSIIVHDTIIKKVNGHSVQIIKYDTDKVKVVCNEAIIRLQLDSVIQITKVKKEETKTVIIEHCTSLFHSFCVKFFAVSILLILIYLGIKIKK